MKLSHEHKKQLRYESLVGLFFIAALAILAYFTILLSPQELFHDQKVARVSFSDIGSLKEGDNVSIRGVIVGHIKSTRMNDNGENVIVTISLEDNLKIYTDNLITIRSSSVLGGQFMDIKPGKVTSGPVNWESELLKGLPPTDLIGAAATFVSRAEESLANFDAVKPFFEEAEKLAIELREDRKALRSSLDNITAITAKVKSGEGTVGRLLMHEDLYKKAETMFADIKSAAEQLEKSGKGIETEVTAAFKEIKDIGIQINSGKGSLGRLIQEDDIYERFHKAAGDVETASANIKAFTEDLNSPENSVKKLLADKGALYKDLESSLANFKEITSKINEGEGTIAKLINDPALYDDMQNTFSNARRTFKEVDKAIQDLREQTPISTFGSLIFGGF